MYSNDLEGHIGPQADASPKKQTVIWTTSEDCSTCK